MVAIENKVIDIYNVASYDSNDMIISVEEELSDTIDIKDSYSLTDSTVLNIEHHILKIDDDRVEILYQEYNGKSETEHLLKHETININNSGFNKLVCSNIDRIYHLSSVPYTTHYIIEDIPHILLQLQFHQRKQGYHLDLRFLMLVKLLSQVRQHETRENLLQNMGFPKTLFFPP